VLRTGHGEKKSAPICRPCGLPCAARRAGRLWNSAFGLRQSSPKSPGPAVLLGGSPRGTEHQATHIHCAKILILDDEDFSLTLIAKRNKYTLFLNHYDFDQIQPTSTFSTAIGLIGHNLECCARCILFYCPHDFCVRLTTITVCSIANRHRIGKIPYGLSKDSRFFLRISHGLKSKIPPLVQALFCTECQY